MEELNGILHGVPILALIHLVAIISVIIAMMADLCFGWRKAKIRGEERTSYAFSRTFTKFLLYMGIMIVTGCIDLLIHFVLYMFGYCYFVPVLAIGAAIGLCLTEIWSMKEKAAGQTDTTLWRGTVKLEMSVKMAIGLLNSIEIYACQCFDVTASHKAAVMELNIIEDVVSYDFTTGYPEKLSL